MWKYYNKYNYVILTGKKGLLTITNYHYSNMEVHSPDYKAVTPKELGVWND